MPLVQGSDDSEEEAPEVLMDQTTQDSFSKTVFNEMFLLHMTCPVCVLATKISSPDVCLPGIQFSCSDVWFKSVVCRESRIGVALFLSLR